MESQNNGGSMGSGNAGGDGTPDGQILDQAWDITALQQRYHPDKNPNPVNWG